MNVNKNAVQLLEDFKKKSKFDEDVKAFYPGLSDPKNKEPLTILINKVAGDFIVTVENHPTDEKFQKNIKDGLARFDPNILYLDSEDEDRVCRYFEEVMDCVGLESSNGQLNDWRYGFDPKKKQ